jgi:hypothetical protein
MTCLKETCWDVVSVKWGVERRVFLIGETRTEVMRGAGKIRTYLPTEPPSVAQVDEGLEGIGVKAVFIELIWTSEKRSIRLRT